MCVEADDDAEKLDDQAMAKGNHDPDLILLKDKEISSLNIETLNAEWTISALRSAMISEHVSQTVTKDGKNSEKREKLEVIRDEGSAFELPFLGGHM